MSNIKVGDLVQIMRCCCSEYLRGTTIYVVSEIYVERQRCVCRWCKKPLPLGEYATPGRDFGGAPVSWLKRIPPLSELEDQEREVTA